MNLRNVRFGSTLDSDHLASRARLRSRGRRRCVCPLRSWIRATGASVRISTPASRAALGDRVRDRAGPAAREAPRAERAVDLAHVVVKQHVSGARRSHAEERSDDPRCRHRRLEHVGLEPLIEKIDGAHRHELELVVTIRHRRAP